jgi:hypothetical protein
MQTEEISHLYADFGLDPHVLPQFELLVADGRITQEYADQVIAERRAAGLPMNPAELQPRPEPLVEALTWVAEFGGPEIRSIYITDGEISYRAMPWRWRTGSSGYCSFTSHFHGINNEHTGWLSLDKHYKGGITWSYTKILSSSPRTDKAGDDLVTITASAECPSVDEAIDMALDWEFDAVTLGNGDTLYRTGIKTWKSIGINPVEIKDQSELRADMPWYWTCASEVIKPLQACTAFSSLEGAEPTREQAIERATSAVDRVIAVCRFIVAKHDMDKLLAPSGERV